MMDWILVFVADIVVGLGARLKKRRMMEEMVAVLVAEGMLERILVRQMSRARDGYIHTLL